MTLICSAIITSNNGDINSRGGFNIMGGIVCNFEVEQVQTSQCLHIGEIEYKIKLVSQFIIILDFFFIFLLWEMPW